MPSKPKKNRRVTQTNKTDNTGSNSTMVSSTMNVSTERSNVSFSGSPKATYNESVVYTNFMKDLKWIGVVAGIIIVLLVLAYIFFS